MTTETTIVPGRYVPAGSIAVDLDGAGVVYTYEQRGAPIAIAYYGKARKPAWHLRFRSVEQRTQEIEGVRKCLAERAAMMLRRKVERAGPHPLVVGDVVYHSWGWEQTNVDFYVVVETTKNFVTLAPIPSVEVESAGLSSMAAYVVAGDPKAADMTKTFRARADSRGSVTMRHGCASKWDGEKKYSSWYA